MNPHLVAVGGFVGLFVLMLLRVPVGIAMGVVGVAGFGLISDDFSAAMNLLAQSPIRTVSDVQFAIVPLFLLMGAFASSSGMSRELFRAGNAFVGHLKGGLGIATIGACGGFAAICGSSVATAAAFSSVAYPEMQRYGYPKSFSTGVIAAGGSLGIMIPPSTVLAVYGLIADQDIGKLFIAGILPGILAVCMYIATINIIALVRPDFLPKGGRSDRKERLAALRDIWAVALLFIFIISGLYGGLFTATEAGGMGAAGAFIISVVRRRLNFRQFMECLTDSLRTTAAIFTILVGAILFGYFLTVSQTPQAITQWLIELGLGKYGILALIMLMYLVLGSVMDAMAMILLTVPVVFPLIQQLGFDPIWFGIIIVMAVELGMIHPPVGMNVFVIKSVVRDVNLTTIFKGVAPFVVTDILRLIVLIAFPAIATFLPSHM
ncbi:TRAP transporter large permease [Castellaniella caeni]|uniref:TRAP transporter large permease n=1 Tax=Castellaniella caeni TaxID=266123 RepID=UPI0008354810|nr:TRAP transporter large permease [Castellaniella caeni]